VRDVEPGKTSHNLSELHIDPGEIKSGIAIEVILQCPPSNILHSIPGTICQAAPAPNSRDRDHCPSELHVLNDVLDVQG